MKLQLKCLVCNARIADAENSVTTEMKVIVGSDNPLINGRKADYYLKCKKCKSNIGIWKIK